MYFSSVNNFSKLSSFSIKFIFSKSQKFFTHFNQIFSACIFNSSCLCLGKSSYLMLYDGRSNSQKT